MKSCITLDSNNLNKFNCIYEEMWLNKKNDKLIRGIVKYNKYEVVKNAVIIVYEKYLNDFNEMNIREIGFTTTNDNGEFAFVIQKYICNGVEYILEVFNPLINIKCQK